MVVAVAFDGRVCLYKCGELCLAGAAGSDAGYGHRGA